MDLHRANFDVHGLRISAEADSAILLDAVRTVVGDYAVADEGCEAGGFRIRLRYSDEIVAPSNLPEFWRGVLPSGNVMVFRCGQRRRQIEVLGKAAGWVDLDAGAADFTARPGMEGALLEACILPTLCDFLNTSGHYVIHAASLLAKDDGQGRAVMISGLSGRGKTTASLALAADGFALLADDMTFYTAAGPGQDSRVWGIRMPCKVHPQTLELLPWLREIPSVGALENGEVLMDVPPKSVGLTAAPAIILFLNLRNPGQHIVRPIEKTDALARLVNENVRAYEKSRDGGAGRAFAAMSELVRRCQVYQASFCPDLQQIPSLVRSLLE